MWAISLPQFEVKLINNVHSLDSWLECRDIDFGLAWLGNARRLERGARFIISWCHYANFKTVQVNFPVWRQWQAAMFCVCVVHVQSVVFKQVPVVPLFISARGQMTIVSLSLLFCTHTHTQISSLSLFWSLASYSHDNFYSFQFGKMHAEGATDKDRGLESRREIYAGMMMRGEQHRLKVSTRCHHFTLSGRQHTYTHAHAYFCFFLFFFYPHNTHRPRQRGEGCRM